MKRPLVALCLLGLLAACDGGGDPVDQALRDASAANHAATVREGVVSRPSAAAAGSADEADVARMMANHREAMAIADRILARSQDPEMRRMAETIKEARAREIAALQARLPGNTPGV